MGHYETLGVPRNSTGEEIKKAYKKLAKKHHPDSHQEKEKEKHSVLFKNVKEAYEIIGDATKRSLYDRQGYAGRRPPTPRPKPTPKPPTKTKEDFQKEKNKQKNQDAVLGNRTKAEPNVDCTFFTGGGTGRSILVHLKLTPQEMKRGCTKSVFIKKRDFCVPCGGIGEGSFVCTHCRNGKHAKYVCPQCNFQGIIDGKCPFCNGSGQGLWMVDKVIIKISPNVQIGHTVNVIGRGEDAPGIAPGNVRMIVVGA